jgi:hypothetical protein
LQRFPVEGKDDLKSSFFYKKGENLHETCGSHEPLPEVGSVEDQEEEVGKVEHVSQVEHLEVTAHPEHGNNFAALR